MSGSKQKLPGQFTAPGPSSGHKSESDGDDRYKEVADRLKFQAGQLNQLQTTVSQMVQHLEAI